MEIRDSKLDGADFVCCVSEMVGAYNERGISYDMVKLLDESWEECGDDGVPLFKGADLKWIKECFEDDWNDPDCGWLFWEVKEIKKWLEKKESN